MFDFLQEVAPFGPDNGIQATTMTDIAGVVLNVAIGVGIALATITIVVAGIKFVLSGGDPKAVESAQKTFTYSIYALILTFAAFTIRFIVLNLLGVDGDLMNTVPF